jgi:hypothetical protein
LQVARVVSVLFLGAQAMLMLIVAYTINDILVSNVDVEQGTSNSSAIVLIAAFLCLTAGNITWIVFGFIEFGQSGGCLFNKPNMIITCVAGFLFYALIFLRTRQDASIFTSSLVLAYCLFLQWSALAANTNTACNPYYNKNGTTIWLMCVGLLFTFISLFVISSATVKSEEQVMHNDEAQAELNVATGINAPLMEKENPEDVKIAEENIEREARGEKPLPRKLPITNATLMFQFLLILATMYYAMILTNWGNPTLYGANKNFVMFPQTTEFSYWIQLVAQWISILLYLFSLLAPLFCKNRSFK